jgi:pyridoxine 4-dehydrogenase
VIPGTADPGHLRANVAAAEVAGNLADAEVARLTGLVNAPRAVLGQPHQPTLDAHRSAADSRR